jgi:hypothetical protein
LFETQDPSSRKEARKREPNRQVMPQNESITRVQLLEFPSKDVLSKRILAPTALQLCLLCQS